MSLHCVALRACSHQAARLPSSSLLNALPVRQLLSVSAGSRSPPPGWVRWHWGTHAVMVVRQTVLGTLSDLGIRVAHGA